MAKKYKGFGDKTFDEWLDALTEEEYKVLSDHVVLTYDFDEYSRFALWVYKGIIVGTGRGKGTDILTQLTNSVDRAFNIASDKELRNFDRLIEG